PECVEIARGCLGNVGRRRDQDALTIKSKGERVRAVTALQRAGGVDPGGFKQAELMKQRRVRTDNIVAVSRSKRNVTRIVFSPRVCVTERRDEKDETDRGEAMLH